MLTFQGITEKIFRSIYRRFGVTIVKCRLMEAYWLAKYLPDHEKYSFLAGNQTFKSGLKALKDAQRAF